MFKIGKGLLKRATKCQYEFRCLTDERFMCLVDAVIDKDNLMVEKKCLRKCNYSKQRGTCTICSCLVRNAIFKRYGCHMIRHAFGFTKDLTALSFEKLERTAAIFAETTADDAPPATWPTYDQEAVEVIARNSSQANYMQDDHTLRNVGKAFVSD